ncbi:MAG TPA: hypothetical protein DHU96_23290 [Actinobacteria bacterium]|nr:hypothetical protein [Actinomycetota bacterium]
MASVIPPSPVVVSADLADAALGCTALVRARKLAEWVGPGRELTSTGVLRPAVAAEACQVLGISLPGARLRSALDVDELMRDWTVAVDAGFLAADGRHAWAAPDLAEAPDPELVLNVWVRVAARSLGVPGGPCAGCLTVLHELAADDAPVGMKELAVAVTAADPAPGGEPCPDCGAVHDPAALLGIGDLVGGGDPGGPGSREHAEDAVAGLVAFGAAVFEDGVVRLTPLGSMLAAAVLEGCAPPPDADAETLVSVISEVPPPVAMTMAGPWLDARPVDAAVRELLTFAESASGERRIAALALGRELGPDAAEAWREWAKRPGFGAYARQWLADQGEPSAQDPADEAWLTVDALSIMLDALPDMVPPFLLAAPLRQETGGDVAEALSLLRGSGHPAAAGVVARLTGQPQLVPSVPDGIAGETARAKSGRLAFASAPSDGVYQLKISLCGVSKPPVWRRVVVPADITLEDLHTVILGAMGWHGGHLHVFSTGWEEYGSPDPELGHTDETAVRLRQLLPEPGGKLRYTYDFGDDWEHDILLEKVLLQTPTSTYPSCLAGKGACPPEDCGGVWGYADLKEILADPGHDQHQEMLDWLCLDSGEAFDPSAFSVDAVNTRLSYLLPGMSCGKAGTTQ